MDEVFGEIARTFGRRTPPIHMLRGMQCSGLRWPFASVDSTDIAQNHNRPQNTPRRMAGGLVGGAMPSGGDAPGGGDLHVHVYGGSGDDHIRGLVQQGVSSAIASNNRALPGMLAERQRRMV